MKQLQNSQSKIYQLSAVSKNAGLTEAMRYVLEHRDFRLMRSFWRRQLIGIKGSCSHQGNDCKCLAGFLRALAESTVSMELRAFICETSARHKKISSNALDHIEEAYCDCYDALHRYLPFFMLDGITGNYELLCQAPGRRELFLGGELPNLDGMLVLCLPYSHELCGIAASLHCLGAGLASKRGKIKMHTQDKPKVNVKKCYACRRCLHECPVKAISMGNRHVIIDEQRCIDCGKCVEIAKYCGISYDWNASPEHFQRIMIEHAAEAMKILAHKAIFISILTEQRGREAPSKLIISRNPVALDAAVIKHAADNARFSRTDILLAEKQLELANELNMPSVKHELIEIKY